MRDGSTVDVSGVGSTCKDRFNGNIFDVDAYAAPVSDTLADFFFFLGILNFIWVNFRPAIKCPHLRTFRFHFNVCYHIFLRHLDKPPYICNSDLYFIWRVS